jgi:hypothetical protein
MLNNQVIVWDKCFFTLPVSTPPGSNGVFVLGVYYQK